MPMVRDTDALLVWGGDPLYLAHWMRARVWPISCRRCARDGLCRRERREHRRDHHLRRDLREPPRGHGR